MGGAGGGEIFKILLVKVSPNKSFIKFMQVPEKEVSKWSFAIDFCNNRLEHEPVPYESKLKCSYEKIISTGI